MPLISSGSFSRKTLTSNVMWLTVGSVIAQSLIAASVLLVARLLGPVEFGEYAASFAAAGLSSVLFNLGLDTWLLRSGARRPLELRWSLGNALTIKLALGLPWLMFLGFVLPHLNPDTFQLRLVLICGLSVWMEGLFSVGLSSFRALLRNETTAALLVGARGGVFALTALLGLAGVQDPNAFAGARLAVAFPAFAVTMLLLPARPVLAHSLSQIITTSRESFPYALSDLLISVYVQADVMIAAIFLGKRAAGLYAPASNFISALTVVPTALFYVTVPVIADGLRASWREVRTLIRTTLAAHVAIGLALWVAAWLATDILPFLLGAAFRPSVPLLAILSPLLFLKTCSFGAAAVLVAVGWQSRRVVVQAVAAITNVVLNLLLIQEWGISGVAWIYVVSEMLLMVGYMVLVRAWLRRAGQHPEMRSLA